MSDEERLHQDDTKLPSLTYEVWAQVSAELLQRTSVERLEILEHRSITPDDWKQADTVWMAALVEDIGNGGSERVNLYARLCAEEMQARQKPEEAPPPDSEQKSPPPPPAETRETRAKEPPPAPPAAPIAEPFMMPMAQQPSVPQPSFVPTYKPMAQPAKIVNVTRELPAVPASLSGTAVVGDLPRGAALPFIESASSQMGRDNIEKVAGSAYEPPRGPDELSETRVIADADEPAKQVLPFGTPSPTPTPSPLQPGDPVFTVERFASLLAEIELAPDQTEKTLARYGLTQAQRRRLESHWGAKIRAEPQIEAAFREAKAIYSRWLLSTRR